MRFDREKRPIRVDSGRFASSTDSETWSSHAAASKSRRGVGLGFALGGGIGCIDLDHCIVGGVVAGWAREVLHYCPPTYVEVSMSGTGLHVFGLLPEGPGTMLRDGRSIEVYSVGRYIAMTGDRFERSPSKLGDLSGVLACVT